MILRTKIYVHVFRVLLFTVTQNSLYISILLI